MIDRRAALGGIGAALGVGLLGGANLADAIPPPPIGLNRSKLTQGGWATGGAVNRNGSLRRLELDGHPVPFTASDAQGWSSFLIAFDRDAAPTSSLMAYWDQGYPIGLNLAITPRQWAIENIAAPFHPPGMPDADFARIRTGELAQIAAARAISSGSEGWRQDFIWPAKGRISGLFGAQRVYQGADGKPQPGAYHPGLDIALPTGTPYVAPADGVVILAAADVPFTLEGHLLMIDHGMGLNSAFLHSSALLVKAGDRVVQGQPLGAVGMTGRATGPHLHWALKWREARLDPLLFVGPMG